MEIDNFGFDNESIVESQEKKNYNLMGKIYLIYFLIISQLIFITFFM
jgi:hypothetical protein